MAKVREMNQRKLTDDELQKVMSARHDIKTMCCWLATDRGSEYWGGVANQLNAMALHATTDGKPWVDLEPPIPDGYRKAVAIDEGRRDVKFWSPLASEWQDRPNPERGFTSDDRYIVPVDRVPTDEEAEVSPRIEVMVRNHSGQLWERCTLVVVEKDSSWPFVALTDGRAQSWKHCRHLYPGE